MIEYTIDVIQALPSTWTVEQCLSNNIVRLRFWCTDSSIRTMSRNYLICMYLLRTASQFSSYEIHDRFYQYVNVGSPNSSETALISQNSPSSLYWTLSCILRLLLLLDAPSCLPLVRSSSIPLSFRSYFSHQFARSLQDIMWVSQKYTQSQCTLPSIRPQMP